MSDRSFSDLEVLLNQIRDTEIKQYTSEAINCYYSKSYRAAIIMIWIASVLDLYKKIEYIYHTFNDAGAKAVLESIEKSRQQGKAIDWEKQILTQAKDEVKIINKEQYQRLLRIEEDRHKCAHPVMDDEGLLYLPTAEEARAHIRNSIEILLSQNAIFGKNFADNIIQIVEGPYVGEAIESIKTQIQKYINNSNEIFRQQLILLLLKKLIYLDVTNTEQYWIKYINTLKILCDYDENDFYEIKDKIINIFNRATDSHLGYMIRVIHYIKPLRDSLENNVLDRLEQFAEKDKNFETKLCTLSYSNKAIDYLIEKYSELAEWDSTKRFYDTNKQVIAVSYFQELNNEQLRTLTQNAVKKFVNSDSFYQAEKYGAGLRHLIKFLVEDDICLLLEKSPENRSKQYGCNQLGGMDTLFLKIYLQTKDKFKSLQPKWEEFILYDFLDDTTKLKWVIEGNNLDDFDDCPF